MGPTAIPVLEGGLKDSVLCCKEELGFACAHIAGRTQTLKFVFHVWKHWVASEKPRGHDRSS